MNLPTPSYIKKTQQFPAEIWLNFGTSSGQALKSYLEIGCKFGGSLWSVARQHANRLAHWWRSTCPARDDRIAGIIDTLLAMICCGSAYDVHLYHRR